MLFPLPPIIVWIGARTLFFETINAIKNNNIRMLGAGADIDEARKPVIVEVNGCKIGFLDITQYLPQNYFASKEKPGCNPMRAPYSI